MAQASDAAREYSRSQADRFLSELEELLRIPSISTDPAHAGDIARAAEWLAGSLREIGAANVAVMPTAGYPVVYGEWLGAGPDKPTVLVYGHYDVVPAALKDGWDTPPFEPVVKDGKVYARGAADDKGQLFIHAKALRVVPENGRRPPGQRQVPPRRRGGGLLPQPAAVPGSEPRPARGRRLRHQRLFDAGDRRVARRSRVGLQLTHNPPAAKTAGCSRARHPVIAMCSRGSHAATKDTCQSSGAIAIQHQMISSASTQSNSLSRLWFLRREAIDGPLLHLVSRLGRQCLIANRRRYSSPNAPAFATAAERRSTSRAPKMAVRWRSTVRSLIPRVSPISRLLLPAATSRSTST